MIQLNDITIECQKIFVTYVHTYMQDCVKKKKSGYKIDLYLYLYPYHVYTSIIHLSHYIKKKINDAFSG